MTGVALVTGAAGGIGSAIARRLLEADYTVAATDLSHTLDGADRSAVAPIPIDVRDNASVQAGIAAARELGPLRAVINCAGVLKASDLDGFSEADLDLMWQVNVHGAIRVSQAALQSDELEGIVNIGSVASRLGRLPGISGYAATKSALASLTRALAVEVGPRGIRVNAVEPGFIEVPMSDDMRAISGGEEAATTIVPLGRMGTPEEVAEVIAFLLSPQASYIHGAVIAVDGGAAAG
jgi:3-oxoacyl-[acyl-carrier protein] reductase